MRDHNSRALRRERKKKADRLAKHTPSPFVEIDLTTRPDAPKWLTKAFSNNRFVVMLNSNAETTKGKALRVMIQRHDALPIPNHWAEMQAIKNEIFGNETVAVEYYPAESELVNDHNIYWLWIFEPGILPIPII